MEYFKLCCEEYGKALRVLGSNLMEFFSNLDGLHEQIKTCPRFQNQNPPSFRCDLDKANTLNLHFYTFRRETLTFVAGAVEALALALFNVAVTLTVSPNRDVTSPHQLFFITPCSNGNDLHHVRSRLFADQCRASPKPTDSKMSVRTFCASFPFHVIFDRNLLVTQLGAALVKMVTAERVAAEGGLHLGALFQVVRPRVKMSFSALLSRLNSSFTLRARTFVSGGDGKSNGRLGHQVSGREYLAACACVHVKGTDVLYVCLRVCVWVCFCEK